MMAIPAASYSLRTHVLRSLIATKRPDVPPWVVARNTAAVVLPMAVGLATGHEGIGLGIGAGALNTMFSDQPGPYRQRLWRLVLASLAAGTASLLGLLLGAHALPLLAVTAVCGFLSGMLVVFGPEVARLGMTLMILLVVTAATPMADCRQALEASALLVGGGLLLTAFSVAAWPLQRYRPERQALATVFRGLANVAREPTHSATEAPELTEGMTTLQQTLLGRHHARGRAMEAFLVLLELAERIRLELTAMNELQGDATSLTGLRLQAARLLSAVARSLDTGDAPKAAARLLETLQANERSLAPVCKDPLSAYRHALIGQLAAVVRNAHWAGSRGELRAAQAERSLPDALRGSSAFDTFRANLRPHAVAFRHAVRWATCIVLAQWLYRTWGLAHGYWLPMTVAIVLRPDFAATFNFGLLRVVGTMLGLMLTSVLLYVTPHEPWAHLLLMALLCMAFRYLATAHYGVAVAGLTGTVVILLSFEGVNPSIAVWDRVISTVLGCAAALAAYVLWPTWERVRTRGALSAMLDAYADYLGALSHPSQRVAQRDARTAARMARSNAQASLERMRAEPGTPPQLMELADSLFANGNRLARTAMALEALMANHAALPQQQEIGVFVSRVASALREVATCLAEERAPNLTLLQLRTLQRHLLTLPGLSPDQAVALAFAPLSDRLVDNVHTLAHVVDKASRAPAAPIRLAKPG